MFSRIVRVRLFLRSLLFGLLLGGTLATAIATVRYDMTRAELLQELGKPTSVLKHPSGREILLYPKKVRIELNKDRVVSVKGLDLAAMQAFEAEAAEAKLATAEDAKRQAEEVKVQKEEVAANAKAEKEWAKEDAKARAEMEKSVEELENRGAKPGSAGRREEFELMPFVVGLVIKWALMLASLKLATKYWNADVDWSGLMLAAGVDTAVRGSLGLVAHLVLHTPSLFYIDEAIASIVLVLILRKVSTNQSLNQAVTITFTVKTFSIVVGSVVMVALMNLLH